MYGGVQACRTVAEGGAEHRECVNPQHARSLKARLHRSASAGFGVPLVACGVQSVIEDGNLIPT